MRKISIVGLAALLLVIPLVLVLLRTPVITTLLPAKNQKSDRYSVHSDVPGYTVALTNTSYLDYITANAGVFGEKAVIDPESYQGGSSGRHTITQVKFLLVPDVAYMMVGVQGKTDFAAKGWYTVVV